MRISNLREKYKKPDRARELEGRDYKRGLYMYLLEPLRLHEAIY